jgi:glutathione S-transferase
MKLFIGNKNYSSWSLRPWLALKAAGVSFEETIIPLRQQDTKNILLTLSPNGKVPMLQDGNLRIWESISICEYVAEKFPSAGLLPKDPQQRAKARSLMAEMHAGFASLRKCMPMDIRTTYPPQDLPQDVQTDIARILSIWSDCRANTHNQGDFLLGPFGIVDAMYAPVVMRFRSYNVPVNNTLAQDYCSAILYHPAMQDWIRAAEAEPWEIPSEILHTPH